MIKKVSADPFIEIVSISETEDGRQQAVVIVGRKTSAKLRDLGTRQTNVLRRYLARGLKEFSSQEGGRIVARIPAKAVELLNVVCEKIHSSRSGMLLSRVERYVDADGETIRRNYPPSTRSSLFGKDDWTDLAQIQVVAPRIQVRGFNGFCRRSGIKKSEFFTREVEGILRRHKEPIATDEACRTGTGATGDMVATRR
jgi:hypothetical protein